MFEPSQRRRPLPTGQAWVCLLLTVLLLYNPFVMAPSSGLGLNVRHSASHRATVGASELQQFRASERLAPAFRTEALVDEILFVKPVALERFVAPAVEVLTAQDALRTRLWFRPPPTL